MKQEYENLEKVIKDLAFEGKNYDQILNTLEVISDLFHADELKEAKKTINDHIVNYQLAKQEQHKALTQAIVGVVLFFVGAGLTIVSFLKGKNQFIIVYGAIFVGLLLFIQGIIVYRSPLEDLVPQKRRFSR